MKSAQALLLALVALSVAGFCLLTYVDFHREWKTYQDDFYALLASRTEADLVRQGHAASAVGASIRRTPRELQQIWIPELNIVDRCGTCHLGMEEPLLEDAPQPHAAHPPIEHEFASFGCTVCHEGQGRAVDMETAHGTVPTWEKPILPVVYTAATCGRCHTRLYAPADHLTLAGAPLLARGKRLYQQLGCAGCHVIRGRGGTMGPDLTDEGSKVERDLSFRHVEGEHTVVNWHLQHFRDPQRIVQDSKMPQLDVSDDDIQALTAFMLSLQQHEYPVAWLPLEYLEESGGRRADLTVAENFTMFCAYCHGAEGEGRDFFVLDNFNPALNNDAFLAMASDEFIRATIANGRPGRPMAAWDLENGGLSDAEIDELVRYIRRWQKPAPDFAAVQRVRPSEAEGAQLYRARCGTCHGLNGMGGIGPALNNQDFQAIATERFIYDTMTLGRSNTAMPSWSHLPADQIAHLIAYVKHWQTVPSRHLPAARIAGDVVNGETLFQGFCSGCHGRQGQGAVGPAITNPEFLRAASDHFIRESVFRGRVSSSMRSWGEQFQGIANLEAGDIDDIVAYLRSWESRPRPPLVTNIVTGSPTLGQELYTGLCAGCHGPNGEGKIGPALNNRAFLAAATDGFLQATIALGRPGTAMRSWAKGAQGLEELNAEEINHIVSFIRTWQGPVETAEPAAPAVASALVRQ